MGRYLGERKPVGKPSAKQIACNEILHVHCKPRHAVVTFHKLTCINLYRLQHFSKVH